ncbi:MAG: acetyl-CoA carboxylase biotin carboxyl carrier protein subunit [Pseudomonadota bacterium]
MSHSITLETGGTVWKVLVKNGDAVSKGQTLFIMEVMKMEVPYDAPADGTIADLDMEEGAVLTEGHKALRLATSGG